MDYGAASGVGGTGRIGIHNKQKFESTQKPCTTCCCVENGNERCDSWFMSCRMILCKSVTNCLCICFVLPPPGCECCGSCCEARKDPSLIFDLDVCHDNDTGEVNGKCAIYSCEGKGCVWCPRCKELKHDKSVGKFCSQVCMQKKWKEHCSMLHVDLA